MALLQIQEPGSEQENQAADEVIIGIDLGTTNSLVAIIEDGKIRVLADENGRDIFPSVVKYSLAEPIEACWNSESKHASTGSATDVVISSVKRLMGKDRDLRIAVGDRKIRPEEVSAEILKHLKNIAEKNLKKEIRKAVITVPAYFDEAAKNATKLAANLADLEVVRLVNEPTAAALAYGLDNSSEGIYCVYDLGGGTFDVSVLKMQKGVFKVLGVAGDNQLGGDDFDDAISKKFSISHSEARKIKENLSEKDDVMLSLSKHDVSAPSSNTCFDRLSMTSSFSREDFEKLISAKIEKTFSLTKNLLDDLELESSAIKGVILVGGSTRIPLVRKKLAEIFGAEKILTNLDPDRVVAIGAAWQAYNLSGQSENLLLDVVSLSLGIEMMGGITDKIILRNSTIPTSVTKEFTTYADNQNGMKLHIVQGERELASDCRSLANFEIKNIPAMKAGLARVAVTFKLDADGLLTVTAEEKITKEKQEIEVRPTYSLDESEIRKMLFDSMKNSQADMEQRLFIEAVTAANKDIAIIKKDLGNFSIQEEEKKSIEAAIQNLEKLITDKTSRELIIEAQEQLGKAAENLVLQKVNEVISKKITGKKVDEI
jgi:molecular chaperone HscA